MVTTLSPFVDAKSFEFEMEDARGPLASEPRPNGAITPFVSLYELEDGETGLDATAAEYLAFLNELYDREFDQTLFELASEAAALVDSRFANELHEARPDDAETERFLEQHFAPLARECEAMIDSVAGALGGVNPGELDDREIDAVVERYQPSMPIAPNFEDFWGKFKKAVSKVAKGVTKVAKKGLAVAANLGLGPVLAKLKALIKPLLKKVLQFAIGKLPSKLQPIAKKLAERIPFLKELEVIETIEPAGQVTYDVRNIQQEFNYQIANVLFAPDEVDQELEVARVLSESQAPADYSLAEFDRARAQFVEGLSQLKEAEDPTPLVEQFVPAILPALKLGIKLAGRKRVVNFLAKFVGKLITRFVGPQYAPALSQAIVDSGLRLISLEAGADDEARAAGSAVAATVEETVRRVAALPDYILDDSELLENFALESFEQAAAANLPPVLPERTYRKRPDLLEAKSIRGTWVPMPLRGRKRYKKYSRILRTRLNPHKALAIRSFGGARLGEFLEEQLGMHPAEDVEANIHLFEVMPGTLPSDITRHDQGVSGVGSANAFELLHPLTPEAAGALFGEPGLGRETSPSSLGAPYSAEVGQRLYFLEIPGKRPAVTPGMQGTPRFRHLTEVLLLLDLRQGQARVYVHLSEVRSQALAVQLRQPVPRIGDVAASLGRIIGRGLNAAVTGKSGRLKIIHETVVPEQELAALQRVPSPIVRALLGQLDKWILKGLSEKLREVAQPFLAATEDPADGVTMMITVDNPPGFAALRDSMNGRFSLGALTPSGAQPTIGIQIKSGHHFD